MLAQTFSVADLMMIAIVFIGTAVMMVTGGLSVKPPKDRAEADEAEPPAAVSERDRIQRRYRTKWGSRDSGPSTARTPRR
jgi:hypothetical protein